MGGLDALGEAVDGVDESAAHERAPEAVDGGFREAVVREVDDLAREEDGGRLAVGGFRAVEEAGRDLDRLVVVVGHRDLRVGGLDDLGLDAVEGLAGALRDAAEAGGHAPEILLRDGVVRMVVALGALHLEAEEDAGDAVGDGDGRLLGVEVLQGEAGLGALVDLAVARDEGGGDAVVGELLLPGLLEPADELREVELERVGLFEAVAPEEAEPAVAEEGGGFVGGEEAVDEDGAFFRRGLACVGPDLIDLGEASDQVHRGAAEELVVVRGRGGGDVLLLPAGVEVPVDDGRDRVGVLCRGGGAQEDREEGEFHVHGPQVTLPRE